MFIIILCFMYVTKEYVMVTSHFQAPFMSSAMMFVPRGGGTHLWLVKASVASEVQLGSSATWQCFENQYSYLKLGLVSMLKEHCDTKTGLIINASLTFYDCGL